MSQVLWLAPVILVLRSSARLDQRVKPCLRTTHKKGQIRSPSLRTTVLLPPHLWLPCFTELSRSLPITQEASLPRRVPVPILLSDRQKPGFRPLFRPCSAVDTFCASSGSVAPLTYRDKSLVPGRWLVDIVTHHLSCPPPPPRPPRAKLS